MNNEETLAKMEEEKEKEKKKPRWLTRHSNSYNRYLAIASRAVRRSLKEDKRIIAERRGESDLKFAKWKVGSCLPFFPLYLLPNPPLRRNGDGEEAGNDSWLTGPRRTGR